MMNCALKVTKFCPTLRSSINVVTNQIRELNLGIVGANTCSGQPKKGVDLGPSAIRSAGLLKQIQFLGHDVIDFGDFTEIELNRNSSQEVTHPKLKNQSDVRHMFERLSSLTTKVIKSGRIPITLGGDHSAAVASITSSAINSDEEVCVVWVDAHADINTVESTTTGNFHGMASSFLIKQVQQMYGNPNQNSLPVKPSIDANNMVYIGLRDVQSRELDIIRGTNIQYFTTQDIDKLGIHEVIARALDKINPQLKRKIHVSFDIDAIDPLWAPSTGTAVPGGLTLREALCVGEQVFATKLLCGLDLVEVNPSIGSQLEVKTTVNSGIATILSFLGKNRVDENIGLSHNRKPN